MDSLKLAQIYAVRISPSFDRRGGRLDLVFQSAPSVAGVFRRDFSYTSVERHITV